MAQPLPITDYKDLSKLHIRKRQNRDPAQSDLRQVYALDTETYQGNVFLIADSDGRYLDRISADTVLDFLFCKKYECAWNFFFNLGYDAEVILKLLGKVLFSYQKTRRLSFRYDVYRITYIPNKCLRIVKGHHSVAFYDVAQFFGSSLVQAYQDNIGVLEQDYLAFKSKRTQFSSRFYRRNTRAVREYCVQDCRLTKALAEKWITLFHSAFGFYPQRWVSSGYLAEKVLIHKGLPFPKFDSIPYEVQDMALRAYFGGRFEILRRGFIGEAYLYDINSAYPYALANLPDLTDGKWVRSKHIHKDAKLGFFLIKADIPDCKHIPPFPFRANGKLVFPSGKFLTYVTLDEIKACENPAYYKVLDSWQFVSNSSKYPYKSFIENMYLKRLELKRKKDPLQLPIKVILNSIYGKAGQKVNRVIGNLFNPVIFAFITGYTRARLYRFVIDNDMEKDVVSFATDSVCTTKRLDLDSEAIGEFSLSNSGSDVYYLQNGIYRFNGKWKQRGFGRLKGKDIEHLETFERDGRLYYKLRVLRSTRLRSSIIQNRLQDVGLIRDAIREIDLNADRKRLWLGNIESIGDRICNKSTPISLNYFSRNL